MTVPNVNSSPATTAVLAIFALTYLGIAAGRAPGLKPDRIGIVFHLSQNNSSS